MKTKTLKKALRKILSNNGIVKLNNGSVIKFTMSHNDKMAGMISISTSSIENPYCKARSKNKKSICIHCYSNTMQKRFTNLAKMLVANTNVLTTQLLTDDEIPLITNRYCRFEAFGDLINETQFINYYNIARLNKNVKFALWTKNPFIVVKAFKILNVTKENRIKNLKIILSSPMLNVALKERPFWFVDKVFTVYDEKTINEKNININCGGKQCITCLKCYTDNKITVINEKLK